VEEEEEEEELQGNAKNEFEGAFCVLPRLLYYLICI
jgi:hypothetical protein